MTWSSTSTIANIRTISPAAIFATFICIYYLPHSRSPRIKRDQSVTSAFHWGLDDAYVLEFLTLRKFRKMEDKRDKKHFFPF